MFTQTKEKAANIIQRLKRSNVSSMQDLELVRFIEEKSKEKTLLTMMKQLKVKGKIVRTCKELEEQLGSAVYAKLLKKTKA